jgi:ATP-binding cassette subfamily C protein CydC
LIPARLRRDPLVRAIAALDPSPQRTLVAVIAGTAALGSAVGLMATSGWLISRAAQQPPVLTLQIAVVATRTFGIGRGVLRYVERLLSHDVALRGVAALRERLYVRLANADPATVSGLRRGDLLSRVGADVDTLADILVRSLLPFAIAFTTAIGSAVLVGVFIPGAGAVIAVALLMSAIAAPWLAGLSARKAERAAARARAETSAEMLSLLDGVAELTVSGAVPDRLSRLDSLDRTLTAELDRTARPSAFAAALNVLLTGAAVVITLILGVQVVSDGQLRSVWLAVVVLTPLAAAEAVTGLPTAATGLIKARAAAERVMELFDAPTGETVGPTTGADPAPLPRPRLRADGLACGWPGHEPVLTGVDLDLPAGRRIAIVGPSGGGKTTLLLTLAGLLPAADGRVRLGPTGSADGTGTGDQLIGLDQYDPRLLRRTVSFTAEDAHIFTTTVRENLRVARPEADDDVLREAVDRAGLSSWFEALPEGWDTMLDSGGTGLSGGERRRFLLARAFLVGAGILLLDEPGEHLDPDTADALIGDILTTDPPAGRPRCLDADTAVLLVTHRLAPVTAADEILFVDSGTVVARGTHAWLLDNHAPYHRAWEGEQVRRTGAR